MSKKKLVKSISQKGIRTLNSQEKEKPIRQKGVSGKALDPQRKHRITFKFISQMARKEIQSYNQ